MKDIMKKIGAILMLLLVLPISVIASSDPLLDSGEKRALGYERGPSLKFMQIENSIESHIDNINFIVSYADNLSKDYDKEAVDDVLVGFENLLQDVNEFNASEVNNRTEVLETYRGFKERALNLSETFRIEMDSVFTEQEKQDLRQVLHERRMQFLDNKREKLNDFVKGYEMERFGNFVKENKLNVSELADKFKNDEITKDEFLKSLKEGISFRKDMLKEKRDDLKEARQEFKDMRKEDMPRGRPQDN